MIIFLLSLRFDCLRMLGTYASTFFFFFYSNIYASQLSRKTLRKNFIFNFTQFYCCCSFFSAGFHFQSKQPAWRCLFLILCSNKNIGIMKILMNLSPTMILLWYWIRLLFLIIIIHSFITIIANMSVLLNDNKHLRSVRVRAPVCLFIVVLAY